MAIQATVDLGNGISATNAYLIIPRAHVMKTEDDEFKLVYNVHIYKDATDRAATNNDMKRISCRTVDHHKIDYDPTSGEQNVFKLAYADLKNNGSLSSITDK